MLDTQSVFALARKHLGNGCVMESSARLCLKDAMQMQEEGHMDAARKWAIRSLEYSIGILHPDYARATK